MDNSQLNKEQQDEKQLTTRLKQGDEAAMKQVFDLYYARLHYYAFSSTENQVDAEDIVQESFMHFWINLREKDISPDNIQAYLYGIVRNQCISYLRKQRRVNEKNGEAIEQFYLDMQRNMTEISLREELYHRVSQQFSQLTTIQVQVMKLMYLEDLSVPEIAEQLNTTPNNVRNHKARAMDRLKTVFESEILVFIIFFLNFF